METDRRMLEWAEEQARSLLSPLGDRWLHTKGVVERAQEVGKAFDKKDRVLLIAAAYLHDIGYAPSLNRTDLHPLDGANYLLSHNQHRLASLVAYHSEAQFEARLRGLTAELKQIPHEHSVIADALTYCDMTTGPTGLRISFEDRLADIFKRYDETHIANKAIHQAIPSLALAIKHTQEKLDQGVGPRQPVPLSCSIVLAIVLLSENLMFVQYLIYQQRVVS